MDTSYIDQKGRTRWQRNDEIAEKLKELADFLVIGGYDESHAARYPRLAYAISRHPESIVHLHHQGRLSEIPGVGGTIATIIGELIETGTCHKMEAPIQEDRLNPPRTVLEITAIPRFGAKMARTLYQEYGIDSLDSLKNALDAGVLDAVPGMGRKTVETVRQHLAERGKDG